MRTSHCVVPTVNASRYLRRLCNHWAHKFKVEASDTHGHIELNEGRVVKLEATADALKVSVSLPDPDGLTRLEEVTADHLKRFEAAFKETLVFDWRRQ